MASRTPARAPLPENPVPRGRSGMTIVGSLLVAAGVAVAAWISQGGGKAIVNIASGPNATATVQQLKPLGTPPANFKMYQATNHAFALYYSTTWQVGSTTVTWEGQAEPATTFTAVGSKIPAWTIVFLPSPINDKTYLDDFGGLLQARDNAIYTPRNGPTSTTIGTQAWDEQDGTYARNGQDIQISAFAVPAKTGAVLVFYEELPARFEGTKSQNFLPMLTSLNLGS